LETRKTLKVDDRGTSSKVQRVLARAFVPGFLASRVIELR